ncbi:hypothetical protein K488DRAFT_67563 [Vararia minispora EC-137]|uniref:Uncharacterized protein n=1 Tax=Vararia minispora EC-137 TaxID=1314806 RepID=A0ACB8QZ61_9AGAM|nr:hypothetical protein K488DRAFT_67563 [Vararia minispora EC-137]
MPSDFSSHASQKVSLPRLTRLSVADHILETAEVIAHLDIPKAASQVDVSIFVQCDGLHGTHSASIDAVAHVIRNIVAARDDSPGSSFRFTQSQKRTYNWEFMDDVEWIPAQNTRMLTFHLRWDTPTLPDFSDHVLFGTVTTLYPFTHVREIYVQSLFVPLPTSWAFLAQCDKVEKAHLVGFCTYGFSSALAQDFQANLLPKLRELIISNAHFSYPLGEESLGRSLGAALANRKRAGRPPLRFYINSSHITLVQSQALALFCDEPLTYTGEPHTWGVGEEIEEPEEDDTDEEAETDATTEGQDEDDAIDGD